jgi:uncharacterized protein
MKHDALLALPLTDAEIEQLDDFLMSDSVSEEAMDVSMMDGFMTALAQLAVTAPLAAWLRQPAAP